MLPHTSLTYLFFFFFNDTATTEIYTLSLHDALPISPPTQLCTAAQVAAHAMGCSHVGLNPTGAIINLPAVLIVDRKSTRLNSSHVRISYAVFCLKKKKI